MAQREDNSQWLRSGRKRRQEYNAFTRRSARSFISSLESAKYSVALQISIEKADFTGSVKYSKLRRPPVDLEVDNDFFLTPPSRSIIIPAINGRPSDIRSKFPTEAIVTTCYENKDDSLPHALVFRCVDTLDTAQDRLGPQVKCTFLRWRIEEGVFLIMMGFGNLKGHNISCDGLPLRDDVPNSQGIWYREARYPVFDRHVTRRCLLFHHWGPDVIGTWTREMRN